MNIFMLDKNPKISAQYHADKHVVKMIVEYAQLLSTAHRVLDGKPKKVSYVTKTGKNRNKTIYELNNEYLTNVYNAAHVNHPSAIWVRESHKNYVWLHEMAVELCKEYTIRYGKIHKTQNVLSSLSFLPKNIPLKNKTNIPLAMPNECKKDCPVESYREYYRTEKKSILFWKTKIPYWITQPEELR